MCVPGQHPQVPATAADAIAMVRAGLGWLAAADAGALTSAEQADCLRGLERASALHTAARARVLGSFHARAGCTDDGHGSTRTWLKWQTQVTGGAAAGSLGWVRRLNDHPAVADALGIADISESWAKQICEWTDLITEDHRPGADVILLGAARAGATLRDLADLAQEIRVRTAQPDEDRGGDGFADRALRLGTTLGGAGKLSGELSAPCAAALQAVLQALGKRAGPEDTRTKWQRDHDALEEACRRLIAAGCLPQRAGQPTQIQLFMTLDQLRGLPGAAAAGAAWSAGMAAAGPGADCDATIVPVVTGHVDPGVLDQLAAALLGGRNAAARAGQPVAAGGGEPVAAGAGEPSTSHTGCDVGRTVRDGAARSPARAGAADAAYRQRAGHAAQRVLRQILVARAADLLSGPAGLAAYLRTGLLTGPAGAVSLPLDVGAATETIPAHLRRAVTARDRLCRFPGCDQPPAACQPHHIIPRSEGGPTSLANLLLLCSFHHLIAVHRWGWDILLLPDGTVTVSSPDRSRTLHSHSPPAEAARPGGYPHLARHPGDDRPRCRGAAVAGHSG